MRLDEQGDKRSQSKKYRENNASDKQSSFKTASGVEAGAPIVGAAKSATER